MTQNNGLTTAQQQGMESTEETIKRLGLTAPRVTPQDIEDTIAHAFYLNAGEAAMVFAQDVPRGGPAPQPLSLLTLCIVTTTNGFTVVGKSACAHPANFNRELGQKIALEDAKRQLWPLLGYALKEKLMRSQFDPNTGAVVQS